MIIVYDYGIQLLFLILSRICFISVDFNCSHDCQKNTLLTVVVTMMDNDASNFLKNNFDDLTTYDLSSRLSS